MIQEITKQLKDVEDEISLVNSNYEKSMKTLTKRQSVLNADLKLALSNFDVGKVINALSVLELRGLDYFGHGETRSALEDAINDVSNGFTIMRSKYFGCKNYEGFICQRCDCEYGMGPRHGSICFKIALKQERGIDIIYNESTINDCLYLLHSLKNNEFRKILKERGTF